MRFVPIYCVVLAFDMLTVTHGLEKSVVFQHVKSKNLAIDWNNSSVIYKSDLESNGLVVESTLIKEKSTFNNTHGVVSIDGMSSAVIQDSSHSLKAREGSHCSV